jgi:ADP-ribose pyrophosphatase YjhB (NUDIX family)
MGKVRDMGCANVSERRFQPPEVGTSVVILSLDPARRPDGGESGLNRLWMPLVRRTRQPFHGLWALPGGSLRAGLSLEEDAYLAVESTTSLHPRYMEQLYAFGDPNRSRGGLPMVSIVYWSLVGRRELEGCEERENVRWFDAGALPELAFDHRMIVDYALSRLRSKIEYPDIATKLVGPTFTLRQLHRVYEAVTSTSMDLANFRRKMLSCGELEDTGDKISEGRQRPATLYRYVPRSSSGMTFPWGAAGSGLSAERMDRLHRHMEEEKKGRDRSGNLDGSRDDDALSPLMTSHRVMESRPR